MTEENKIELIEKFLDDTLSQEESIILKELLENDTDFKKEVQNELDVRNAMKAIYNTQKEIRNSKKVRRLTFDRKQIFLITSLAASICLIIVLVYFQFKLQDQISNSNVALQQNEILKKSLIDEINILNNEIAGLTNPDSTGYLANSLALKAKEIEISELKNQLEKLRNSQGTVNKELIACNYFADKLFEPTKVDINSTRSDDPEFQSALEYYADKNYLEAINLFEELLKKATGTKKSDITFFYASSCLAASNSNRQLLQKAEKLFGSIVKKTTSPLYEEANWYLALTYLKSGKTIECIDLLEGIVQAEGFNHSKAENLLYLLK